ncbi:MAG: radical SAM protein [Bacteroidales bacterium]
MIFSPVKYDEPLFRPPSEAYSFIFQVTTGCSWNRCAFCEMYTSKTFKVKSEDAVIEEIEVASNYYADVRKVFLADGNAMVLSTKRLLNILNQLQHSFPKLTRVSTYASCSDLENKSEKELLELRNAGLKLIYVGIETGDEELLALVNKGETVNSIERNLLKAQHAGIKTSVMILNGLGGKKYSKQHALNSAKIVSVIQPDFLSTLVLSFPFGVDHYKQKFLGEFEEMNNIELMQELLFFLSETSLSNTIFRSDHASNYVSLKGILGRDNQKLQSQLDYAIANPRSGILREEWQRGL